MKFKDLQKYLTAQNFVLAGVIVCVGLLIAAVVIYVKSGWAGLRTTAIKFTTFAFPVVVGGVFAFAGALKVFNPELFAHEIDQYSMLPHGLINLMAITLPWIELLCGLLLLSGHWVKASALVVSGLTVMFMIAIVSVMVRGLK